MLPLLLLLLFFVLSIQVVVDFVKDSKAALVLAHASSVTHGVSFPSWGRGANLDVLLLLFLGEGRSLQRTVLLFQLLLFVSLLQVGEPSLQPLVPSVEGNLELLYLLEQFLRVYLVNVFCLLFLCVDHLQGEDCQLEELFLRVTPQFWQNFTVFLNCSSQRINCTWSSLQEATFRIIIIGINWFFMEAIMLTSLELILSIDVLMVTQ